MTEFKAGSKVKCVDSRDSDLREDAEYTVHCVGVMMLWLLGTGGAYRKTRFELLTPSEPAKEGWVPAVGERVRVKFTGSIHDGDEGTITARNDSCSAKRGGDWWDVKGAGLASWRTDMLEPAEAKPEAPTVMGESAVCFSSDVWLHHAFDHRSGCCSACGVAEVTVRERIATAQRNARPLWDSDRYHGIVKSDLDTRIAAARAEMDRPAPVRFPHPGRNFALTKRDGE